MSFRGRGGGGSRGFSSGRGASGTGQRGGGGFRGGSRGGGGFGQRDFGPPETVQEMGVFVHAVESELLLSSTSTTHVPFFNAPIYLANKTQVGKVDEVLGPINQVYFTVKPSQGFVATSFKEGDKFCIGPDKILPIERFLPKPAGPKAKRGRGAGGSGAGGRGGRGGGGRGGARGMARGGSGMRGSRGAGSSFRGGPGGARGGRGGPSSGFRGAPRGASRGGFVSRGRGRPSRS